MSKTALPNANVSPSF